MINKYVAPECPIAFKRTYLQLATKATVSVDWAVPSFVNNDKQRKICCIFAALTGENKRINRLT
jgi:hypothetical protein